MGRREDWDGSRELRSGNSVSKKGIGKAVVDFHEEKGGPVRMCGVFGTFDRLASRWVFVYR